MSKISGKIIRVNNLPPKGERLTNVIYQVAVPGTATYIDYAVDENGDVKTPTLDKTQLQNDFSKVKTVNNETPDEQGNIDLNNYIQLYNSEEEFQILFDEGLKNKIYYNSATEVIRIGLLDSDGFKEYNFSEIQKIPQLKTALDNEIIERARIDALKINKPTTNATSDYVLLADGSTAAKGDLGKNFANTDLVVSQNRKHTGTASVEFAMPFVCSNTNIRYSGLVSKHNDTTYNRLLGMDTNGNVNEVGLPALTNEMSKSTDVQKDAWRIASRRSDEFYSTGQPIISIINPSIISNVIPYAQNVALLGSSLFVNNGLNPTAIVTLTRIKDVNGDPVSGGVTIDVSSKVTVSQLLPNILSIIEDFRTYEKGYYLAKVKHNGLDSLSTKTIFITDVLEKIPLPTFKEVGAVGTGVMTYDDTIKSFSVENLLPISKTYSGLGDLSSLYPNGVQIEAIVGITARASSFTRIIKIGFSNVPQASVVPLTSVTGLCFQSESNRSYIKNTEATTLKTIVNDSFYLETKVLIQISKGLATVTYPEYQVTYDKLYTDIGEIYLSIGLYAGWEGVVIPQHFRFQILNMVKM